MGAHVDIVQLGARFAWGSLQTSAKASVLSSVAASPQDRAYRQGDLDAHAAAQGGVALDTVSP